MATGRGQKSSHLPANGTAGVVERADKRNEGSGKRGGRRSWDSELKALLQLTLLSAFLSLLLLCTCDTEVHVLENPAKEVDLHFLAYNTSDRV